MKALVDFGKKIRPVGKLNGTNNGPIQCYTDRTAEYRDMGVDFVRFHETHSTFTKCVEIPFIFRDFSKDENDPANYYFAETDAVIKGAVDAGIEIMYRLGMGTENTFPLLFLYEPPDYEKWARIAEHIVRHYTEGWADGFRYTDNFRYLEIWNEADLPQYWPAQPWPEGRKRYIDFYEVAARHLKKCFPEIRIGCCGFAMIYAYNAPSPDSPAYEGYRSRYEFFHMFLQRVKENDIPLDFFGWHVYSYSSRGMWERCSVIRDLLAEFGMQDTELINTEWANLSLHRDKKGLWYMEKAHTFYNAVGMLGSMIVMQKFGNSRAAYYDSDERSSFCLLYEFDGTPMLDYHIMKMWKWLREGVDEVATDGDKDDFRICASGNGRYARVALANEGAEKRVTLEISGLPDADYELFRFDHAHTPDKAVRVGRFTGGKMTVVMPKESAVLIKFSL